MQTEKYQLDGKTKFTECSALSVDQRVGISRSASETDVSYALKIIKCLSSFIFGILRRITTFYERLSAFFVVADK